MKTKLFLLLQTEQYDAALTLIDGDGQASAKFEKSYTLYRLHREPEARVVLEEARAQESDQRGALHLEAQLVRDWPTHSVSSDDGDLNRTIAKVNTRRLSICTISFLTPPSL